MKHLLSLSITCIFMLFFSCKKHEAIEFAYSIPNGNFEQWSGSSKLLIWENNSCPTCVPQFNTYTVQKETNAQDSNFAAKFIFNGIYQSYAINRFGVTHCPQYLRGYLKSNITVGDTALIKIEFINTATQNITASGIDYETISSLAYKKFEILISKPIETSDSCIITIMGGKKLNTEITVDHLDMYELITPI